LKQKLDNNIGNVVDSILQTWGSDEYLEEYFKPEEKFPGMWWYVQKVVTLLNSVNKDVSGKLQKLLDKDDIVSAIINEYLKNTVEKKRRIQLSQMFKVTPPSSIIVRKTPLTIKDTFPPYIINTCDWFKNKSFYQALFGEPILVKLHLLVWFINLPNHLKISFYFDYDYEKEI